MWYLGSPYSRYPHGRQAAYEEIAMQAALLIEHGVRVFCPITHSHPVSQYLDPDKDTHETWMAVDRPLMAASRGLIVCQLEGWQHSVGLREEIETFKAAGKPIVYMKPGTVPDEVKPGFRRIIGLAGFAQSGKDSAARALTSRGWTRVAFADPVREAVKALDPIVDCDGAREVRLCELLAQYSWDEAKQHDEVRRLLQRTGTEAGRQIYGQDCWVDIARRKIDRAIGDVVMTDVRFKNEADMIRDMGGLVVRVDRPGVGPKNNHVSESMPFAPDAVLVNDGTLQDLETAILRVSNAPTPRPAASI